MMDGTTLCPHCNTRFRIEAAQLDAHQGMVRCGHCKEAFDARPGFIPDEPSPQLELPMPQLSDQEAAESVEEAAQTLQEDQAAGTAGEQVEAAGHGDGLDFSQPLEPLEEPKSLVIHSPMPVGGDEQEDAEPRGFLGEEPAAPKRRWPWAVGSLLLVLLLCAQALYFFRVEIAARLPGLKPMLVSYCGVLGCSVPLPQSTTLLSIESSELEADPTNANLITLVALLRNRGDHVLAFPGLELALNDTQDKALARRTFTPADYLPEGETEAAGLRPNREIVIKLKLDTTDLRPTGYRLALFYP